MYELRSVSKTFHQGSVAINAVHDVDLEIREHEFVVVAGPSGSGKTTLLQLLGALDRPSAGSVLFEGRDLAVLGDGELARLRLEAFGFVFQQFNLIPTLTAAQNVEAALAPRGVGGEELHVQARGLLGSVGLAARAEHLPVTAFRRRAAAGGARQDAGQRAPCPARGRADREPRFGDRG
jgi:putative ABC transport system ATP-binding protein